MEPKAHWWRKVVAADLVLYLLSLFMFAYLPPKDVSLYEGTVMVLSLITLIGVVSHASERTHLPLEEWSYLVTGFLGLLTFGLYESYSAYFSEPTSVRITYGMFLLAGAVSGYAAHVVDGGRPRKVRG